jgi:capsular polysaccharide biosynthesis protein
MELKAYWHVILRRWWIIAILVVGVFAASYVLTPRPVTTYTATMRFTVGLAPDAIPAGSAQYYDPAYYDWLVSEYLTDDFSEVVKSSMFAADVAQCAGSGVTVGAIQGSANTQKLHRILTLSLGGTDEQQVTLVANCAAKVLRENNAKYFAQLNTFHASIQIIDGPTVSASTTDLRGRLDLPIRLALAVIAGVALAFLIDYLDDSVRGAQELEHLGLRVVGEIPRAGRGWFHRGA